MIMIAIEGLRLLTNKNILVPLDPFLEADPEAQRFLMDDVHVTLREMLQVDGKQMEYPFSWNNMILYYNTAILKRRGSAGGRLDVGRFLGRVRESVAGIGGG